MFFLVGAGTTVTYTLSLHDALPILKVKNVLALALVVRSRCEVLKASVKALVFGTSQRLRTRSEERFSRNAETDLVCRLLLEKKNSRWRSLSRRLAEKTELYCKPIAA